MSSSGIFYRSSVLLLLVTSFANARLYEAFGIGQPDDPSFNAAARHPNNHSSSSPFSGFNFSVDPASWTESVNSTQDWILNLNLSTVTVNDATQPENDTISLLTYDLTLPEPNPLQNMTNWTMCMATYTNPLPADLTKKVVDDPGDCSVVLGSTCMEKYLDALNRQARQQHGSRICPDFVYFEYIDECPRLSSAGEAGGTIMNFSSTDIGYRPDGTYYNTTSNQTVNASDIQYHGLESRQTFSWYQSNPYPASEIATQLEEQAAQLRIMMFSLVTSLEWREVAGDAVGGPKTVGNWSRLVCQAVDPQLAHDHPNAASTSSATKGLLLWVMMSSVTIAYLIGFSGIL